MLNTEEPSSEVKENSEIVWLTFFNRNRWAYNFYTLDSMEPTSDGGFILIGTVDNGESNDASEPFWDWDSEIHEDICVIKVDSDGNEQWNRTYGGDDGDGGASIQETPDGGYFVLGSTRSFSKYDEHGDVWLIKIDSLGNELWSKTYGGPKDDGGRRIIQTIYGDYIIAAETKSYHSDAREGDDQDIWLISIDSNGNEKWNRTYGNVHVDYFKAIEHTPDGGFIIAGQTENRYTITLPLPEGLHDHPLFQYNYTEERREDFPMLIKINAYGNEIFNNNITISGLGNHTINIVGLGNYSGFTDVSVTSEGEIICVGYWAPLHENVTTWVYKCDKNGNEIFSKAYKYDFQEYFLYNPQQEVNQFW